MKNRPGAYAVMALCIIFSMVAVFLPGTLLAIQGKSLASQVNTVPKDAYVAERSAMARRASAQLLDQEKRQLIVGTWESEISSAEGEMEQSESEAVRMAREKLQDLYQEKWYPVQVQSDYEQWYSFRTSAYKAVETTFHTYGAYFWEIQFEKYDRSEQHTIWMLENGTIFLAWAKKMDGSKWEFPGGGDNQGAESGEEFFGWFPYGKLCSDLAGVKLTWAREERNGIDQEEEEDIRSAVGGSSYVYAVK